MSDGLRLLVADRSAAGYNWRLVSGNGRAVAVSAARYDRHVDAVRSFESLCDQAAALSVQFVPPHSTVAWTWHLGDASGEVVASAERSYDRYGTCIAASRRFVAAIRALGASGAQRLAGVGG